MRIVEKPRSCHEAVALNQEFNSLPHGFARGRITTGLDLPSDMLNDGFSQGDVKGVFRGHLRRIARL